jgi:DNA-binding XRE family transcriptional regulator
MRPSCQLVFRAIRVDSPPCSRQALSSLLLQYRAKSNIKQRVFAEQLGVCWKTLQNWEAGRTVPTKRLWAAISDLTR